MIKHEQSRNYALFQGQWANGLLPHIIFDPDATIKYFSSFEFWETGSSLAADRPSDNDYDRYVYLVRFFSSRDHDEAKIRLDCPFLVQDVLFNALLCQADCDLAEISRIVGKDPTSFEKWAEQTSQAINSKPWDEEHGIYVDFDLVENKQIHVQSAAGLLPLFAGIPDTNRAQRMYSYLNSRSFCGLDEACYALPSYDR
ncbi:hypothetical protein KSD_16930 [Ktedonobacter sp. SOSP1-85]|nr:trehalase family glycosidase [Ktedonobacter sp. SOSP1-85]GHO73922.1 hypothetical protein KSD_16930 [Ktedonobacter sp. SOSP1-85]